jgi:acetolactate synthase-1/2/3 large subunit
MIDLEQSFEPKLSSRALPDGRMVSAPLEDMFPFLSRDELKENLLIPPMEF